MRRAGTLELCLVALLGVVGCGDGSRTTALFEMPTAEEPAAEGFYGLPYPNDIRRDADGTISLAGHPLPNDLLASYISALDERFTGFGVNPTVYFRFTAPIDSAGLPASAAASLEPDSSVYLVNIDPDSPDFGVRTPVRVQFTSARGSIIRRESLAVQVMPGFTLRGDTTYAAIVTDAVRDENGRGISTAAGFDAVLADDGHEAYAPLRQWLADNPPEIALLSAAVFTTEDVTRTLRGVRDVIRQSPAPTPRDVVFANETPFYQLFTGVYDAANFQRGDPPYQNDGGEFVIGDDGLPVVQRSEELRFALSTPLGAPPPSGWPVVIYSHGTGGDYQTFVRNGTAANLGDRGVAVLSMDQVLHGPRNPSGLATELAFFNFTNPSAAQGNPMQGSVDLLNQTHLVESMTFAVDARDVALDPARIMFFGHSQGGGAGPPYLAIEDNVLGAVLSGAGGLLYLSLLEKTEPIDITALVQAIIRDSPLDEFNAVLALLQSYLDPADPASYARHIIASPLPGNQPKHILQSEGFVDRFTPVPTIEALALGLGLDVIGPVIEDIEGFDLTAGEVVSVPLSANKNGVTAALMQYDEAPGSDGHFVVFDIPAAEARTIEFLSTLADTGVATISQ